MDFLIRAFFFLFITMIGFNAGLTRTAVAATYQCTDWRYDDGSGNSKGITFVYEKDKLDFGGAPLIASGGSPQLFSEALSHEVLNETEAYAPENNIYILKTCTGLGDLKRRGETSKYSCIQHDLLILDLKFSYPNHGMMNRLGRCTIIEKE